MPVYEEVKKRIIELIQEANVLSKEDQYGQILNKAQMPSCKGWIVSAINIISLSCEGSTSAYLRLSSEIAAKDYGYTIHRQVGELSAILKNLLIDIDKGLVSSIFFQAHAIAFDDFLDHAVEYQKNNMKNEAGVIAGVVFEDSIRKICERNSIDQAGRKLDQLISELSSKNILQMIKAKRARASAHVRTKATHAQWEEFDFSDVNETIEFTKELIREHLKA